MQKLILSILLLPLFIHSKILITSNCYGTPKHIIITGRVIKAKNIDSASKNDSWYKNAKRAVKYLVSNEIKNSKLTISFAKEKFETTTDDEGYFSFEAKAKRDTFNIVDTLITYKNSTFKCKPYIKKNSSSVGIISDFDDTLAISNVTSKLKLLKNVMFKNYKQKKIVGGMAERFKKILSKDSPFIVITGSPRRLIKPINNFLNYNNFPKRVVIAKKLNGKNSDSLFNQFEYKVEKIKKIFALYSNTKWVLFGDSGEKDKKVYNYIKQLYPNRVIGIYIRDV